MFFNNRIQMYTFLNKMFLFLKNTEKKYYKKKLYNINYLKFI